MTQTVHGIIRGTTIELAKDLGIAEGQQVEVQVTIVETGRKWGEGLRRAAGALADEWTKEDDRILAEIYRERQRDTRQELRE